MAVNDVKSLDASGGRAETGLNRASYFWFTLALIFALATATRFATLRAHYWYDEYASVFFARQPLERLWSWWMLRETNPPLFYTLLKGWIGLGLDGPVTMRLLPLLGGLAEVVLIAAFCRRHYGNLAAVLAAAMAAFAYQALVFSHDLRGYMLAAVAVLASYCGLVGWLESGRARFLLVYTAFSAFATYLHTTMLLWPVIALLSSIACYRATAGLHRLAAVLVANIAVVAIAAWWIAITIAQLRDPVVLGNIASLEGTRFTEFRTLAVPTSLLTVPYGFAAKLLALLFYILAIGLPLQARFRGHMPAPVQSMPLAILYLGLIVFASASVVHQVGTGKTLFWLSGFVIMSMVAPLAQSPSRTVVMLTALAAVLVTYSGIKHKDQPQQNEDWSILARVPSGGTLVVGNEATAILVGEACRVELTKPCPFRLMAIQAPHVANTWADGEYHGTVLPLSAANLLLARQDNVWLLRAHESDPLVTLGLRPDPHRLRLGIELTGPYSGKALTGTPPSLGI